MTITVTGVNGHLGRLVIRELLARVPADRIVGVTRNPAGAADLGIEIRHADFDQPLALREAFAGANKLLIISTMGDNKTRVRQHARAVAAAAAAGVGHIHYTSCTAADTSGIWAAGAHRPTEEFVRATGIPYTFLRNNWYLENDLATIHRAVATGTVATSSRDGRWAPARRADFATATAAVLATDDHENAVYELGAPVSSGFADWAEAIAAETGRDISYTELDDSAAAAHLTAAGLPEQVVPRMIDFYQALARGDLDVPSDDLVKLTGREPMTPREYVASVIRS